VGLEEVNVALEGDIPTEAEVRAQLKRMLDGKRMKRSFNRAFLLEHVVKSFLDGEELSEDILGYEIFSGYAPDKSNDVRVTAINLRRSLSEYYAEEGVDDPIRIDLPKGPKYRPLFSYNGASEAQKEYLRALPMLAQLNLDYAEDRLREAIELQPTYAAPFVALAEIYLMAPFCDDRFVSCTARRKLPHIKEWLATALHLSQRSWRAQVGLGVAHSYAHEWDDAARAFEAAEEIAKDEVRDDPWYHTYLVSRGRIDEASQLLNAKIRYARDDAALLTQYGFVEYVRREYSEAKDAFSEASRIAVKFWPARVGMVCVQMGMSNLDEAKRQMEYLNHFGITYFVGLKVMYLARLGELEAARKSLSWLEDVDHPSQLQLALAYTGLGDADEAVEHLWQAWNDLDPFLLWLPYWPMFDPLRKHERFQALIQQMNLPSGK
jgi:tetratricopeptide (TPR) repeat protein